MIKFFNFSCLSPHENFVSSISNSPAFDSFLEVPCIAKKKLPHYMMAYLLLIPNLVFFILFFLRHHHVRNNLHSSLHPLFFIFWDSLHNYFHHHVTLLKNLLFRICLHREINQCHLEQLHILKFHHLMMIMGCVIYF